MRKLRNKCKTKREAKCNLTEGERKQAKKMQFELHFQIHQSLSMKIFQRKIFIEEEAQRSELAVCRANG